MIKRGLHKTLAEVGKIKTGFKGEKVVSKNGASFQPPKKLDHFIVTTTERDSKTGNFIENAAVMTKLGGKPKELRIRLPFDSIDKNFRTQYQAYDGNKRVCSGDGETAERKGTVTVSGDKLVTKDGPLQNIVCDFETCPIAVAGKCKVSGILSAFLPDTGDLGGVYKFRTHSWNAVSSILGALEFFAANTGGILQGLPLKLVLIKKTTEEHGTINYGTVVLDTLELHGLRRLAIEERESRKMLGYDMAKVEAEAVASGVLDDSDPEEEIAAEFYVQDDVADGPPAKTEPPKEKGTSAAELAEKVAEPTPAPVAEKPAVVPVTELF